MPGVRKIRTGRCTLSWRAGGDVQGLPRVLARAWSAQASPQSKTLTSTPDEGSQKRVEMPLLRAGGGRRSGRVQQLRSASTQIRFYGEASVTLDYFVDNVKIQRRRA